MKKSILLIGICLILIFTVLTGCSNTTQPSGDTADQGNIGDVPKEEKEITLMLDWTPNTNHTGLYVAQDKGYFKEAGLKVKIIQPSDSNVEQVVGSGQAEFGIAYQESLSYARSQQVPVVSLAAIVQHNTSGFAAPVDKKITEIKDLEGKKYGSYGSPVELAILKTMLEKANVNPDNVETINVGAADFFTITKKDVDFEWIYYAWTGIKAGLNDYPIDFIEIRNIAPELDFYTPIVISSEKLIEEDPELVKNFMEAVAKGYEFAINSPDEAADILVDSVPGLSSELAHESQKWLSPRYQDDAVQWGLQKESIWSDFTKWMVENELIPAEININDAYTNDFLPKR